MKFFIILAAYTHTHIRMARKWTDSCDAFEMCNEHASQMWIHYA